MIAARRTVLGTMFAMWQITSLYIFLLLNYCQWPIVAENETDAIWTTSQTLASDIKNESSDMWATPSFDSNLTTTEFNFTLEEDINSTVLSTTPTQDSETSTSKTESEVDYSTPSYYSKVPCTCDLLPDTCDVNCCCDERCSEEDRRVFTDCGMPTIQPDERYCYQEYFVFANNTQYSVVRHSNNLFCIYTDNYQDLQYNDIPLITDSSAFESIAEKYQHFDWSNQNGGHSIETELKLGTPLYVQNDDQTIGYFVILRSFTTGECLSTNPAAYMMDAEYMCHQELKQLKVDCTTNVWLSASTYFEGFKLIRTPQILKNATSIAEEDVIEIAPELCLDIFGLDVACNLTAPSDFPSPEYHEEDDSCRSVVTGVTYDITHNGTYGIISAVARITVDTITNPETSYSLPTKWTQRHAVKFRWYTENSTAETHVQWSGNPGYQVGRKILAGKLITRDTGSDNVRDVRVAVRLSRDDANWLTVAGPGLSRDGSCVDRIKGSAAGSGRIPVLFGKHSKSGCSLKVSLWNLTHTCDKLRMVAIDTLLGWEPPDVVGAYGNSKVENPGEWVPVLRQNAPSGSSRPMDGTICTNVIQTLHIRVLFTNVGTFANAQAKIVGVQFQFGPPKDIKIRCLGRYCQKGADDLVQTLPVTTTVDFVDVSKPAVAVYAEPPTIRLELPSDFFYPFTTSLSPAIKPHFMPMNAVVIMIFLYF